MSANKNQSVGFDRNVGLFTLLKSLLDKRKRETIIKFLFQLEKLLGRSDNYNTLWWKRLKFIINILADIAILIAAALLLTLAGPAAPAIILPLAIGLLAAGFSSRALTSFTNNLDNVEYRKYNWPANFLILAGAALTVASLFFPPLLPVLLGCAAGAYACGIGLNAFAAYQDLKAQEIKNEQEKNKFSQMIRNSSNDSTDEGERSEHNSANTIITKLAKQKDHLTNKDGSKDEYEYEDEYEEDEEEEDDFVDCFDCTRHKEENDEEDSNPPSEKPPTHP